MKKIKKKKPRHLSSANMTVNHRVLGSLMVGRGVIRERLRRPKAPEKAHLASERKERRRKGNSSTLSMTTHKTDHRRGPNPRHTFTLVW